MKKMFKEFPVHTAIVQTLFAAISVLLGYIYTTMKLIQNSNSITARTILLCLTAVVFTVPDYAQRWAKFVSGEENRKMKVPFFALPLCGAVLYYVAFLHDTANGRFLLTVCAVHALLFVLFNWFLTNSHFDSLEKMRGRFYVVMPLMTIVIQHALLGCCITMAANGVWVCLLLMMVAVVFYVFFYAVRKRSSGVVSAVTITFLALTAIVVGLYFLDFYATQSSAWLMHPYTTAFIKGLGFSVYCGVVIYVPGMVSLTYIYVPKPTDPNCQYSGILFWLGGAVSFFTYLSWLLVDYSTLYLIGMTIASTLWVVSTIFNNKTVSVTISLAGSIIIGIILCTEFLGLWSGHTIHTRISEISLALPTVLDLLIFAGTPLINAKTRNQEKGIMDSLKHLGILGKYMIAHFVTFVSLLTALLVGASSSRVCFAVGLLFFEMLFETVMWVFITLKQSSAKERDATKENNA